jgi:hypothetical protein
MCTHGKGVGKRLSTLLISVLAVRSCARYLSSATISDLIAHSTSSAVLY